MQRDVPFAPGEIYHLYTRGVDKRNIFSGHYDKERFMILLYIGNDVTNIRTGLLFKDYRDKKDIYRKEEQIQKQVDVLAYCLMDNHIHLLVKEREPGGTHTFMQKTLTSYSKYFNKKEERTGTLFESKFKSKHIDSEAYFRHIFSYIHLNPLKLIDPEWKTKSLDTRTTQGYTEFLESYPYSSYKDYTGEMRPERSIVAMNLIPDYFDPILDIKGLFESMRKNEEQIIP